jgi:hypothetical protein
VFAAQPQAGAPSPMSAPEAAENAAARKEFGRQMDVAAGAAPDPLAAIEVWAREISHPTEAQAFAVRALHVVLREARDDAIRNNKRHNLHEQAIGEIGSGLADLVSQRDRVREVARKIKGEIWGNGETEPLEKVLTRGLQAVLALAAALGGGE